MSMTIESILGFALVGLVILIKLGLLALVLILIGQGLFGRRPPAESFSGDNHPSVSGDRP